jgi:hypothetical protein
MKVFNANLLIWPTRDINIMTFSFGPQYSVIMPSIVTLGAGAPLIFLWL